jgi:hypothetical protein
MMLQNPSISISSNFSLPHKKMSSASPEPAQTYLQLRQKILSLTPADLGLESSSTPDRLWGVLMEIGYEVGSATLICLADGTTSLYFSTGGGFLGSADYTPLAEASRQLVAEAETQVGQASPADEIPLPAAGQVRFTLLTYHGKMTVAIPENTLAGGNHPLSPQYQAGRRAMSQLHSLSDKKHHSG